MNSASVVTGEASHGTAETWRTPVSALVGGLLVLQAWDVCHWPLKKGSLDRVIADSQGLHDPCLLLIRTEAIGCSLPRPCPVGLYNSSLNGSCSP